MKKSIYFAMTLLLGSCAYHVDKAPEQPQKISANLGYADMLSQVFGPKCARCHGNDWASSFEATRAVMPEMSARIQSNDSGFKMPPPGADPLSASEKAAVLSWIARGGPQNGGVAAEEQIPPVDAAQLPANEINPPTE